MQLAERIKRAEGTMNERQQKAFWQKIETFLSFFPPLLGALLGKRITKGTISQTGTSIRKAGRIGKDSQGAAQAEENFKSYRRAIR